MSRWFRHYAGMARDDKLVRVALKSRQTVERVVWVWGAILESAAEIDDGGRYELDCAEIAYFLRADESDIACIVECMQQLGRVSSDRVVKWGDRQFQSDRSAERVRAHRERKRNEDHSGSGGRLPDGRNGLTGETVTLQGGNGNDTVTHQIAETETELEEETDEAASAASSASAPAFDEIEAERRCREAAGSNGLGNFGPIAELLHRQADLERDVLPVIRSRPALRCGVKSWRYYVPIIEEALAKRAPPSKSQGPPPVFVREGTPEFNAWQEAEPGKHRAMQMNAGFGFYAPAQFPTPTEIPNTDRSQAA